MPQYISRFRLAGFRIVSSLEYFCQGVCLMFFVAVGYYSLLHC